ncbi:hypothetical protein SADUNF_Sadunf04G0138500 [Salix dunnii]|uniref:Uncharacterized protein n=1 Tax=Salix dunnii TaxID=1413687 RepID=A0A835K7K7_9ROSI|nr:hypothetical protein SADUNF_Sadunf04G0138500 [Salix dunnii]
MARQNNDETDYLLGKTSQPPRKEADQPILTPSQTTISFEIKNYTKSVCACKKLRRFSFFASFLVLWAATGVEETTTFEVAFNQKANEGLIS